MRRNLALLLLIGAIAVVVGLTLSVGAYSRLIGATGPYSDLDFDVPFESGGGQGLSLIGEPSLSAGDSVSIKFDELEYPNITGIVIELTVEDSTLNIIKSQQFVYNETGRIWQPDLLENNPWTIFTCQTSGDYNFYLSIHFPETSAAGGYTRGTTTLMLITASPNVPIVFLGLILLVSGLIISIYCVLVQIRSPNPESSKTTV